VAKVHKGRFTADMEDDFVVFMIGMRLNKPWRVRQWWPVFKSMPPMLRELRENPSKGLLGSTGAYLHGPAFIQYWRSFEDLERFARDPDDVHHPAWRRFNKVARASEAVGIWHETYRVRAGEYETHPRQRAGDRPAGRHAPDPGARPRALGSPPDRQERRGRGGRAG
jgi:Domain of unknown function (DUF4188)